MDVNDRPNDTPPAALTREAPTQAPASLDVPPRAPSAWGSVLTIFTKPRATFEGMAHRPLFGVAMAVVLAFQLVAVGLAFQSGAIRNDAVKKTQAALEKKGTDPAAIPGQVEQTEAFFSKPIAGVFVVTGGVVAFAFFLLVGAGLLYFMANLMLGAKLRFTHYLCAAVYGSVIGTVDQAVRVGLAFQTGTLDARLGVGALFGDDVGFLGRALDALTDPLHLWALAITALGVSVFARKGFGFGVIALLPSILLGVVFAGMQ